LSLFCSCCNNHFGGAIHPCDNPGVATLSRWQGTYQIHSPTGEWLQQNRREGLCTHSQLIRTFESSTHCTRAHEMRHFRKQIRPVVCIGDSRVCPINAMGARQARYPRELRAILPLCWPLVRRREPGHPLGVGSTTPRWNRGKNSERSCCLNP